MTSKESMIYYSQAERQIDFLEVLKMKMTKIVNVNVYCDVAIWEMNNGKFLIEGDRTEQEYDTLEEAKNNLSNSIYW